MANSNWDTDTGYDDPPPVVCPRCDGRGWVGKATGGQFAHIGRLAMGGRLPKETCSRCNGTGRPAENPKGGLQAMQTMKKILLFAIPLAALVTSAHADQPGLWRACRSTMAVDRSVPLDDPRHFQEQSECSDPLTYAAAGKQVATWTFAARSVQFDATDHPVWAIWREPVGQAAAQGAEPDEPLALDAQGHCPPEGRVIAHPDGHPRCVKR